MTTHRKPRFSRLRRWHRWCGLGALLFLLVAAVTGTLLVYKKELVHAAMTPDAALPMAFSVTDMSPQLDRIAATVAPASRVRIKAPNADEPYWTLFSAEGHEQLLAIDTLQPHTKNRWLLDVMHWLREVHTELLTGAFGESLLLASGVLGLFLSITGLVLWWPIRRSFRWRWVLPKPTPARLLLMTHRHGGAVAATALILVMLTGSLMLWQKLIKPLLPPVAESPLPTTLSALTSTPGGWLIAAAQAIPDGWPIYIRLPTDEKKEVSIRFRLPGEWHPNGRTTVTFDAVTGAGKISARSDAVPPTRALLNQLYPLHSGYGMQGIYMALIFSSGIALLWLALTGGLSYWNQSQLDRQRFLLGASKK